MADVSINDLTEGTPLGTDEFVIQRTGGGLSNKYTLDAMLVALRAIGEAHSNADSAHSNITTTPIPLEGYDGSNTAVGVTVTLTPAGTSNNAKFVINSGKEGTYRITFAIDVESPSTTENVDFVLYKNGVETPYKASVDMSNAAIDRGTANINSFVPTLIAGDELEMFANSDGSTFTDLLVDSLTFTCEKVAN